jgi:hypothetical protein
MLLDFGKGVYKMDFNTHLNNYDEYLKYAEKFDAQQLHIANSIVGIALIAAFYTTSAGIIPFFKGTINPTK